MGQRTKTEEYEHNIALLMLWKHDADLRREMDDDISRLEEWMYEVADRLIESAAREKLN